MYKRQVHESFYKEVDIIAEDFVKQLKDVDVCIMHFVLYQGWHLVHNLAIRKAQKQLPNVRFLEFTHSLPAVRPKAVSYTHLASHELRTPISVIKGACEYGMKYDETPEERQETITMIHRQAEKMSTLVSELLSMTRLDQGTERANFTEADLSALTKSICQEQTCLLYTSRCV